MRKGWTAATVVLHKGEWRIVRVWPPSPAPGMGVAVVAGRQGPPPQPFLPREQALDCPHGHRSSARRSSHRRRSGQCRRAARRRPGLARALDRCDGAQAGVAAAGPPARQHGRRAGVGPRREVVDRCAGPLPRRASPGHAGAGLPRDALVGQRRSCAGRGGTTHTAGARGLLAGLRAGSALAGQRGALCRSHAGRPGSHGRAQAHPAGGGIRQRRAAPLRARTRRAGGGRAHPAGSPTTATSPTAPTASSASTTSATT